MFHALEEAEGLVFVVEFVCDCGDGGATEEIYRLVEAGFEGGFDVISQGDALFAGGYFGERTEPFAETEGEGFSSWFPGFSGFRLLSGFHIGCSQSLFCNAIRM